MVFAGSTLTFASGAQYFPLASVFEHLGQIPGWILQTPGDTVYILTGDKISVYPEDHYLLHISLATFFQLTVNASGTKITYLGH